jgi:multiple sugar transport system substrate-binding protein
VGSATAGTCPDAAANQTIEMWSPLTGPDGDEMSDLAARFSSENEWGITVNHVPQPDYMRSLTTPGGVLPALTVARVINVGELASRHVLRPFSADLMAIFGEDRAADFPENLWARGEFNGERYSIPLDGSPLVMYYNKDMFAAANVEEPGTEPWTKAEFEAALAALETSGVQPISLGTGFQAGVLFHTFIYQFGGALTNEDGTEVTFASPEGVEALTYLKKLRDESGSTASGGGDPEVQPFTAGTAAIVIHGPWHISNMVQLPFAGFAPLPQVGDNYAVWGGSHQFALTTDDAAKQAAAMCWISWMSDNSVQWGAAGQVPARTSVREDPELATVAAPIAAVAGSSSAVQLLPQVPALEDAVWGRGYGPAVDAILLGDQTDIQAALTAAQATSQQIVDDNAAQFATP